MYQYSEIETDDPEHVEREDQEVRQILYAVTTVDDVTGAVIATTTARTTIVCSCGLERCYAIGVFGLPRPIYLDEIAPLPGQSIKDRAAAARKASL